MAGHRKIHSPTRSRHPKQCERGRTSIRLPRRARRGKGTEGRSKAMSRNGLRNRDKFAKVERAARPERSNSNFLSGGGFYRRRETKAGQGFPERSNQSELGGAAQGRKIANRPVDGAAGSPGAFRECVSSRTKRTGDQSKSLHRQRQFCIRAFRTENEVRTVDQGLGPRAASTHQPGSLRPWAESSSHDRRSARRQAWGRV